MGGGDEPTPDAYDRALGQWQELPGAVRRPASEVRGGEATQPPDEGDADAGDSSADDREERS